ncbi:MAG: DUF523 domain-containing protein [Campylobacteraceae bacterium]|nr:DUF523 domain-containing protein [Campylobacteraceae bacterium]
MKVLVSACLLGENCKYSGGNNLNLELVKWLQNSLDVKEVIPVCPEVLAGFGVPRPAIELVDVGGERRAKTKDGKDVHDELLEGVKKALKLAVENRVELAILQPRSPSCGVRQNYDGTFSKKLINESGAFAKALKEQGIEALDADEVDFKNFKF